MSPQRVPIIRPSSGVRPMDVSMLLPPSMAVMEAPLPKWQVMIFRPAISLFKYSAARMLTYLWEVP